MAGDLRSVTSKFEVDLYWRLYGWAARNKRALHEQIAWAAERQLELDEQEQQPEQAGSAA